MISEIKKHQGRIDKIYYCTATENKNPYRKPNIGMGLLALRDFPDIDLQKTVMIGDSESDMLFAKKMGIKGLFFIEG